ncbi:galectin-9-like [Contarinia nasturtii]|uniref:galectin-9-like n=1 Tax=Contarinia nasturtii TaxID=265458 RepID=UPI0012D3E54F|nr:galectin-9-like [Contarinia nasturtii]
MMRSICAKNPEVPLLYSIPECLRHNSMIELSGQMLQSGRFRVDLKNGYYEPDGDIAFHLSVRPSLYEIVRNHKENKKWQEEENEGGCPIEYGGQFKILIFVENDMIKVCIDNCSFCEFRPRLPLSSAKFLYICGDVTIHYVKIIQ